MPRNIKGMTLLKKDLEAISYLHRVKVATYEQIRRDIYVGYHLKSVCNRIYRLENNGLVTGICDRMITDGKRILSLTGKGFDAFVAKGTEERIELRSDSVEHDLTLVDIRSRLLNAKKVRSYYTENEIQTWGIREFEQKVSQFVNLNSDALVDISFSNGDLLVPLEYEKHPKSSTIYESLLKRYYSRSDVAIVLYICETGGVVDKLQRTEKQIIKNEEPRFLYTLIENFEKDETMKFTNCNGKSLRLNPRNSYD